jgi:hypothetical protein
MFSSFMNLGLTNLKRLIHFRQHRSHEPITIAPDPFDQASQQVFETEIMNRILWENKRI